ncbi:hypothetical protein [Ornithinimicrobium kibberense]|uniref:hypothetical protein n=1 Tax=Ornithinimicrobium kibberense TaxID=282060 RepID=UPI00360DE6D7
MEASRAAISASTRARSTSSGAHRWVLAVTSSSGASCRIAASLSRRSPAVRSASSTGAVGALTRTPPAWPGRTRPATARVPRADR